MRLAVGLFCVCSALPSQVQHGRFHDRDSLILSNDKIELTVLPLGGSFARILLKGDPDQMNPMWDSLRQDEEDGVPLRKNGEVGHFVCVDGFGSPSEHERAAGMTEHGEANTVVWTQQSYRRVAGESVLVQSVRLPKVHEVFTRMLSIRDGEYVVRVHSTLESLLDFDRPVMWTEHACIGSPFLTPRTTVVDLSSNRAITRPWKTPAQTNDPLHRLLENREFHWPMAPLKLGGTVDLRAVPEHSSSMDQTGQLMTVSGKYAFVTALNTAKRLLLGYVFKTAEYPWLQNWESYRSKDTLARGLEFSTTVFGRPRRDAITENRLFDQLLYRWLPAKLAVESTYLMFWTRVPEGIKGVDEISVEKGKLRISDWHSRVELTLNCKGGL